MRTIQPDKSPDMPVIVEHIENPALADQADLLKIHTDAPLWLKAEQTEQWLIEVSRSAHLKLYGARFNDRLLGAAVVTITDSQWNLEWLNIRTVTRNRGVGNRLVSELIRMAENQGCKLYMPPYPETANLPGYLTALSIK